MPDFLKKEIGPFPVAIWLVIIVVGAGAGIALNRRIGSTDEEPIVLEPDTGRDPFSAGVGAPSPYYTGATTLSPSPAPATDPVAPLNPPATNDEWLQRAVRSVSTGPGAPLPLAAMQALQAFLDGVPLTADQTGIVNRALGVLGPPPYGVLPTTSTPAPSVPVKSPTVPAPSAPSYDRAEQVVVAAYRDLLGRTPDRGGLQYWADMIRAGTATATQVRGYIAATPEAQSRLR